jgi:hypothetical protein
LLLTDSTAVEEVGIDVYGEHDDPDVNDNDIDDEDHKIVSDNDSDTEKRHSEFEVSNNSTAYSSPSSSATAAVASSSTPLRSLPPEDYYAAKYFRLSNIYNSSLHTKSNNHKTTSLVISFLA